MNALLEKPELKNDSIDGWPSTVDMKVIDPGVVYYEDLVNQNGEHVGGNVLVQKAALDRMAQSLNGKPIINWDHRTVKPGEYAKGRFQGIVTDVYYNADDGWYHARGYVWDESTKKNIENGFSISCAYQVSEWADGGTYHKVPYEKEVVNGSYTHIAVVSVPRYEGARIELLNSAKGGGMAGILSLFKKDKPEEKVEIDLATAKIPVEGMGEVSLVEMVNSYKASHPKGTLEDMDLIDVDGKKVSVKELKNSFLKNAEMSKLEKEHKDGEHEDEPKKNCGMCNSAAAHEPTNLKEKASELPKTYNSAEEKEKEKMEKEERENAEEKEREEEEKKNALSNAAKLEELRNKDRRIEMPTVSSLASMAKEGESRYGSAKAAPSK